MKRIIYTLLMGSMLLGNMACRKYVEIGDGQSRTLKFTSDYQLLLNNGTVMNGSYSFPIYSGDDVGTEEQTWQNVLTPVNLNAYKWGGQLGDDKDWNKLYSQIYICNAVVTQVMSSEGGTVQEKNLILSSALVHRAYIYYTLVNMYAKQYNAATAASDPGVPMVLDTKFFTDLTRVSVQKVYDQIKADLTQALPALPDLPNFIVNPSKAAVYAMMARVHLNTREFSEAERYADLALALKNTLIDLNTYKTGTPPFPLKFSNPEEIFFKSVSEFPLSLPLSADAINMYDRNNDIRYTLYLISAPFPGSNFSTGKSFNKARITNDGAYVGPSVPEIMLIKAECEARANHPDVATGILNVLRKKRYNNATPYTDLSATTGADALRLVVDERKREFVGRGFRWFDQRRLSLDAGLVNTVTRTILGTAYTLQPGDNKYTYQIGEKYIQLNPEIVQNPR